MDTLTLLANHSNELVDSGTARLTSPEIVAAVISISEAHMLSKTAEGSPYVFNYTDDALAFFKEHKAEVIRVNEIVAWNEVGGTAASVVYGNFWECGLNDISDAEKIIQGKSGDEFFVNVVHEWLANTAVNYIINCCDTYLAEREADEKTEAFFEYRDSHNKDGLISWHLGERVIEVIGGSMVFLDVCKREEDYSVATDGIEHYFSTFTAEDFDLIRFAQHPDFQHYKPSLIQTISSGMRETAFQGFIPSYDEVDEYFETNINKGRTNQAGCSIIMWIIERLVSQLKSDYNKYAQQSLTA